ncbi:hypothetical protein [Actinomyces slackii]|uniref:hypothetical protein n=1 Tax=Actinomyces slackii TaxID=52774 RepID=UPI000F8269FC|nr:hypothetical protein [Actinomyces slackii]
MAIIVVLLCAAVMLKPALEDLGRKDITSAQVGECVTDPSQGSGKVIDCGNERAKYRIVDLAEDSPECVKVAGAESIYYENGFVACMALASSDLAKEINTIAAGDCVTLTEGQPRGSAAASASPGAQEITAERSPCESGAFPVLAVAEGTVPTLLSDSDLPGAEVCTGVEEPIDSVYSWRLERIIPPDGDRNPIESLRVTMAKDTNRFDFSLCLGDPVP